MTTSQVLSALSALAALLVSTAARPGAAESAFDETSFSEERWLKLSTVCDTRSRTEGGLGRHSGVDFAERVDVGGDLACRGSQEEVNTVPPAADCVLEVPGVSVGDLNGDGAEDFMAEFDIGYQNIQVELYVSDADGCMRNVWSGAHYLSAPVLTPVDGEMPTITDCEKDGPYINCRRSEWNGTDYARVEAWQCWNRDEDGGHDDRCGALGYEPL